MYFLRVVENAVTEIISDLLLLMVDSLTLYCFTFVYYLYVTFTNLYIIL